MTTKPASLQQALGRVHSRGYWRVLIHPTTFDDHRIGSLDECWNLVESTKVNLRWALTYPTVNLDERDNGDGWVQSSAEWYGPELWRFYQSGQFIHHFAVFEDWVEHESGQTFDNEGSQQPPPRALNALNVLFTLTEILAFAGRLAYRDVLSPAGIVRIELHGMRGRSLASKGDWRLPVDTFVAQSDTVDWSTTAASIRLFSRSDELAREAATRVFAGFGYELQSSQLLETWQRRLRERRL